MPRRPALVRPIALTLLGLLVLGGVAVAIVLVGLPGLQALHQPASGAERGAPPVDKGVNLVKDQADVIQVERDVISRLGIKAGAVDKARPRKLELSGSLALDPQTLARVRARFGGEIVEITQVPDEAASRAKGQTVLRPLRPGDRVGANDRLAIIYSKELGEKKSELVDAVSQLRLDEKSLKGLQDLLRKGDTSPQRVREQERQVETDRVAVDRAERTLRLVYGLEQKEINRIKDEVAELRDPEARRRREQDADWARADVKSRQGGVIVEKNVVVGDIVDTTLDLFKVADVDRLAVWAHAYEEDLPALQDYEQKLKEQGKQVPWSVRLKANPNAPPVDGHIQQIKYIVDPAQHTVLVEGVVPNSDGRLRAGQSISATVELPAAEGEVAIPIGALVEDGKDSIAFVLLNPDAGPKEPLRYQMRRLVVTRRGHDFAQVRSEPGPEEKKRGLRGLDLGQQVVVSGALELKAALEDLQPAAKPPK